MDRENTISAFEKIINVCKEDGCDFVDLSFEDAEQILALVKEQEAMHWVSVKDRLPDKKWTDYLVATRLCDGTFGINIAWLNSDDEWKSNDEWICDGREVITHWMPLPEPPEEEKRR